MAAPVQPLEALHWHDGNLVEVSFSVDAQGLSTAVLKALLYADGQAAQRQAHTIRCDGVSRFQCSVDADELRKNLFAGHIAQGYLKDSALWIYFTDGLLEVRAHRFSVATATAA